MKEEYSVIEVKIKLDPVPGWGHEAEDHIEFIKNTLDKAFPWYKPEVKLLRVETKLNERPKANKRGAKKSG